MAPLPKKRKISGADAGGQVYMNEINFAATIPLSPQSSMRASKIGKFQNRPTSSSSLETEIDISKYIPAGCLRLERLRCDLATDSWDTWTTWKPVTARQDFRVSDFDNRLIDTCHSIPVGLVFHLRDMGPFRALLTSGWTRFEFKIRDDDWGTLRIYILPEDVGRAVVDRNDVGLRKALQQLLASLDSSQVTWEGRWELNEPIQHIDQFLDDTVGQINGQNASLLQLFNTLPSPSPNTEIVKDVHARSAMYDILEGSVYGLKTTMLPYQRRSAAMMLQKEAQPENVVDPRLQKRLDRNGEAWYFDLNTGVCLREPRVYEASRGGICAETMGLGKTLICLSLILATKGQTSHIPIEYSVSSLPVRPKVASLLQMSAAAVGRSSTPWKGYFDQLKARDGIEYDKCVEALKKEAGFYEIPPPPPRRASRAPVIRNPRKIYLTAATLVVVPPNLVRQWEHEIEKHTYGLTVLVMNDIKKKLPPAEDLADYDIILFSRQRFDMESRDGTDFWGRRAASSPKNPSFRHPHVSVLEDGDCFMADNVYHSPLKDLHFKRLITDEGHVMGNAAKRSKNQAVIVVDYLQLDSRWIVSGTPTPGLYGLASTTFMEIFEEREDSQTSNIPSPMPSTDESITDYSGSEIKNLELEKERTDLEKLGNIARVYLKSRPWANSVFGSDGASWSQYITTPRLNFRNPRSEACLCSTLQSMMIRHRLADVEQEVQLPPLYQKTVYLEGCLQDKLSLNIFAMMINSNAVTSERQDVDYLFHPRQRKALAALVANLRTASFFWSGFDAASIQFTLNVARSFLEKNPTMPAHDKFLLEQTIETGQFALEDSIWWKTSQIHEMPIAIENEFSVVARERFSLLKSTRNPTIISVYQLLLLQKVVNMRMGDPNLMDDLENSDKFYAAALPSCEYYVPDISPRKAAKLQKMLGDSAPALAGGVEVGVDLSPTKKSRMTSLVARDVSGSTAPLSKKITAPSTSASMTTPPSNASTTVKSTAPKKRASRPKAIDPVLPLSDIHSPPKIFRPSFATPFDSANILSTGSAKLSYLLDQVLQYYLSEKIIIFYENDNVAYYISQALDSVSVPNLIYAKTLTSDRRAHYLVTFNSTPRFRVLLMDISQAAFGLDISSASRVFFVNPVVNKQVEAQAVKRAHRIRQIRPVYVETLVLRDSIEELIMTRREEMSSDEQKRCKTVLDDRTMYDWIKNVRFVPLVGGDAEGVGELARLERPQTVFGRDLVHDPALEGPDDGLVGNTFSHQGNGKEKGKGKGKGKEMSVQDIPASSNNAVDEEANHCTVEPPAQTKKRKQVNFAEAQDMEVLDMDLDPKTPNAQLRREQSGHL